MNGWLITAGADAFPFPYVKGIFGTVVFLLEAVQKVKQDQESMKELSPGAKSHACGTHMLNTHVDCMLSPPKNKDATKVISPFVTGHTSMQSTCVLSMWVPHAWLFAPGVCRDTVDIITVLRDQILAHGDTAAFKFKTQCRELEVFLQDVLEAEVIKVSSTVDEISRFRTRMQELRSNFMLMATMDTNFQVQKVLTVISPGIILFYMVECSISSNSADVPVVQVPQQVNNCLPPSKIFHGRQIILQKMHQYFTQTTGKQNIFLLHGLGGAGKTQIELKFIAKSTSNFTDIFFIDNEDATDLPSLPGGDTGISVKIVDLFDFAKQEWGRSHIETARQSLVEEAELSELADRGTAVSDDGRSVGLDPVAEAVLRGF
ncbi:hypothetical protein C8R44DRAFT_853418 [Mycena epipterygia]|nr:hypothetical protein C8R44DRAFT_853418 [Mycena epipterygia]